MKKVPWGFLGGVCLILAFYLTVGIVVAFLILNAIAAQTSYSATLFDTGWQILMFVLDVISVIGIIGCFSMYAIREKGGKRK